MPRAESLMILRTTPERRCQPWRSPPPRRGNSRSAITCPAAAEARVARMSGTASGTAWMEAATPAESPRKHQGQKGRSSVCLRLPPPRPGDAAPAATGSATSAGPPARRRSSTAGRSPHICSGNTAAASTRGKLCWWPPGRFGMRCCHSGCPTWVPLLACSAPAPTRSRKPFRKQTHSMRRHQSEAQGGQRVQPYPREQQHKEEWRQKQRSSVRLDQARSSHPQELHQQP